MAIYPCSKHVDYDRDNTKNDEKEEELNFFVLRLSESSSSEELEESCLNERMGPGISL